MIVHCVSIILCVCIGSTNGAKYMETKADYIKTCNSKDPNFTSCLTKASQSLFKQLAIGIDGLPDLQFDPMKLKDLHLLGDNGPVSLNTTITNGVSKGFSNIVVEESYINPTTDLTSWTNKLYFPKLRIEGHYRMHGRILVLPLVGSGKCWFEPTGMNLTVRTKSRLFEQFGRTFFNITDVKVQYKMSGLRMRLHNLFDGVKVLEDSTNQYFTENWRPVSESLRPIIAKTMENSLLEIMNKIYNFIPANYFLSDIRS